MGAVCVHPTGLKGPPQLLPASLALNPSVQAGEEMKLRRASWKRPVTSCATLEKLQVSLALVPICVKGWDQSCHKNQSPYFGKWEGRRYLPEKRLETRGSQVACTGGVSPRAARALGCPSLPRGWHPVGNGAMTLLHSLEGSQVLGGETSPVQVQAAGAANSARLGQRASVKQRLHSPPWRAELWYVLQLQDIEN